MNSKISPKPLVTSMDAHIVEYPKENHESPLQSDQEQTDVNRKKPSLSKSKHYMMLRSSIKEQNTEGMFKTDAHTSLR